MMASTSPLSASRAAASMFCAAMRPASMSVGVLEPLSSQPPTIRTSASSGCRNALRTTSGPMPRGSPTATARRGRLESDVDVGLPLQLIDEVPDRELIAECLFDFQLHILERQIPRVAAARHFQHHKLRAR